MKKRSKIVALALTFMFAIGLTAWSYAHNKKAALVHTVPNHYQMSVGNCTTCNPDFVDTNNFECTTQPNEENIRCTCDFQTRDAYTGPGDAVPCTILYLNPIQ